jgi:hypothetical protein
MMRSFRDKTSVVRNANKNEYVSYFKTFKYTYLLQSNLWFSGDSENNKLLEPNAKIYFSI